MPLRDTAYVFNRNANQPNLAIVRENQRTVFGPKICLNQTRIISKRNIAPNTSAYISVARFILLGILHFAISIAIR